MALTSAIGIRPIVYCGHLEEEAQIIEVCFRHKGTDGWTDIHTDRQTER